MKSRGNDHYVIEVNCNPGIDAGEEDEILGDEFYKKIMTVFLQRMRANHGMPINPRTKDTKIAESDVI